MLVCIGEFSRSCFCDISTVKLLILVLYSTVVPKQSENGEDVGDGGGNVRNRPGAIEATTVTDLIDLGEASKVCSSTVKIPTF